MLKFLISLNLKMLKGVTAWFFVVVVVVVLIYFVLVFEVGSHCFRLASNMR